MPTTTSRYHTTEKGGSGLNGSRKEGKETEEFLSFHLEAPLSDQTDIRKLLFFHNNESKPFPSSPFVIGLIIKRPVDVPL